MCWNISELTPGNQAGSGSQALAEFGVAKYTSPSWAEISQLNHRAISLESKEKNTQIKNLLI